MERTDSQMRIDGNVGGAGVSEGDTGIAGIARQVALAQEAGLDGVWSTEISRDPFLPLVLAAQCSPRLEIGTAVAVAFARNPMTIAVLANDLQTYS
ncbi:MAG: LLM class flavin-dependent oxidoreductase, partial [Solirubrobacterales bacterium]|nr:LLM class flavin-dependent oxidoreductase [Solirubrobacterales bacterium]